MNFDLPALLMLATLSCQDSAQQQLHEARQLRDASLFVMASFAECRDDESGSDVRRTEAYVRTMAIWLPQQEDVGHRLNRDQVEHMAKSAPLRDIGKVTIPEGILLKPGRLCSEECSIMKTHGVCGWELLNRVVQRMGSGGAQYLSCAMNIALHHNAQSDGGGYLDGLAGEAIPLSARQTKP